MRTKKIYERSFSYFIIREREKMKENFGENWYNIVTERYMKNIISSILDNDSLIMSNHTKFFWRNKMKYEFGRIETLRIFYDTQLASEGLRLSIKNNDYN